MSNPPIHALVVVPDDLSPDEQGTFIGRLLFLYNGEYASSASGMLGCGCYKICTHGQWTPEIESTLLQDLRYKNGLRIQAEEEFLAAV